MDPLYSRRPGQPEPPLRTENTWTAPRPDCPHPEHWHAPDAQGTEAEVTELVAAMVRALQPGLVVETGTHLGATAEAIGYALHRNGHGHLFTIEIDAQLAAQAMDRVAHLPVTVERMSSLTWVPPGPIDFAWLDSDAHRRQLEVRAYLPWMHDRTVVGIHDTGPQHPVRGLLQPLEDEGLLLSPLYLPTPRGVCFARVRGVSI